MKRVIVFADRLSTASLRRLHHGQVTRTLTLFGSNPYRTDCAKVPFFNNISTLCANVSETEAKADLKEADRADADPNEVVALYVRVSTADQSLDRQRQLTHDYATDRLGVEPSSIQVYTDKRSGTNTDRSGYADLMNDLASGEID